MHPKKWLEQGCHWATWLLSARWKRAFRNSNTEKIENIEFKRGINSGIRERQSKRILIFPHDELLQCFFCEISNTKSFPLIVHLRGASGFAESPQGDWADIPHNSGHCWRIRRATRYTGSQPQMVCIFTAKGSNFVFCRFYHPGYDTSGQVSRAKPAAHGNPHTSGPQFTQHSHGQGIHLPVCGLGQGQHPSWGHLEIRGRGLSLVA